MAWAVLSCLLPTGLRWFNPTPPVPRPHLGEDGRLCPRPSTMLLGKSEGKGVCKTENGSDMPLVSANAGTLSGWILLSQVLHTAGSYSVLDVCGASITEWHIFPG